jgi:uncharacterized LabA/DUF88 family protein
VSKNVAVFVDVANIFYAAKAAGVDIDYVTLLKAATAGRDFVRAYAYTGLDPENDNQRQFHSFLARSGYKVISKDIRKYGDGRIKANLDIELVVDMMKTARNLDIAVVVSGDGDFASAIRAVQEMGVRVEVISFRGNTSSDLIDVADLFTDIAQVARVEKGSARSGRRVAAEGDMSMTEVPEKETEGAPRRRRGRATEERQRTPVAVAAESEGVPAASLVALPGERLARGPAADSAEEAEGGAEGTLEGGDGLTEDGLRRRRRRGGRGRGRGRRTDEAGTPLEPAAAVAAGEDEEEFDEPQPANLPHHTFGSVWDSQIGVPSSGSPAVDSLSGEVPTDEDLDEPEVPEYLLAERRQGGGRSGSGTGARPARGRSAYQAALDRERFGSRGAPQPTFGGTGTRSTGTRSPGGGRDRGRGSRPMGQGSGRPTRAPRMDDRPRYDEARSSAEPWSEVPPELEKMLRAEMSRKVPAAPMSERPAPMSERPAPMSERPAPISELPSPIASFGAEAHAAVTAEAKPARRTRTVKVTATEASSVQEPTTAPTAAALPVKATRARTTPAAAKTTATRTRKAATTSADVEAAPKKPPTRRKTAASGEPAAEGASEATEG